MIAKRKSPRRGEACLARRVAADARMAGTITGDPPGGMAFGHPGEACLAPTNTDDGHLDRRGGTVETAATTAGCDEGPARRARGPRRNRTMTIVGRSGGLAAADLAGVAAD